MKKTLVAYFSQTGNTQAVAEAIFEALHGEKDIRPIDEAVSVEGYGLVFFGFPVQSHSVPCKAETFLRRLPADKPSLCSAPTARCTATISRRRPSNTPSSWRPRQRSSGRSTAGGSSA